MKKLLLVGLLGLFVVNPAPAGLVLSDAFSYPDGPIVGASGSPWTAHSGSGSMVVTNGELRVNASLGEDINAPLTGAPYDTTNNPSITSLYSSFTVNFTSLPGSSGTYIAHFRDNNIGFRGRVFALTSGTNTGGTFRIGIASTNSASTTAGFVPWEEDLSLHTTYTVVTRLNLADGTSTLWLNPTAEGDSSVSSTANPGNAFPMASYAFRQSGGGGVVWVDNLKIGTSFADVAGANTSPTISTIASQNTGANTPTDAIPFTIGDSETAPESLNLSATSSNTALVPNGNITFGGSGANRTVTLTPAAGQQGVTTITISVSDGVNTSSTQFVLTVGAPTISTIGDQTTYANQAVGPIAFTINDVETPSANLTLTGSSSNPGLLSDANITFGGSGSSRTVTLTPEANQNGVATVTITVSDGVNFTSTTFSLAVSPSLGIVFADDFNYPDGSLYLNPSGTSPWQHHDPVGANFFEVLATNGAAFLSSTNFEDVNASLTNGPFATDSGIILYAKFTVNFSTLPSLAGNYFVHLKDNGSGFRMKIFASTTNAASGSFRLGIANLANSATVGQIPTDLNLNTTYTVVTHYNGATGLSKIWLNPTSEASPSVAASDSSSPIVVHSFAFRESTGIGTMLIDDLKIGTSFSDVFTPVATPPSLSVSISESGLRLAWPLDAAGFVLETKSDLNASGWSTAPETPQEIGGEYVVTIPNPTGNQFYRLNKP